MERNRRKALGIISFSVTFLLVLWGYYDTHQPAPHQPTIKLYLHQENKVRRMELEDYIKGTVAAEIPAWFEIEAMKAQAVCARTYAVKKIISGKSYPIEADLSDDIATCQAFVSSSDFAPSDPNRVQLLKKIGEAVDATRGEILLHDSLPIDALYCSTCGGRTESAGAVWGTQTAYLQPVTCTDCIWSPYYRKEIAIDNQSILGLVGASGSQVNIRIISRTPGGRPQEISINGDNIQATSMRQRLGLPSTWLEFQTSGNQTTILSRGYGHGVGLCQFGANGMAKRGCSYRQILQKYYQGTTLYNLGY